jgi:progressive ankylosis protein
VKSLESKSPVNLGTLWREFLPLSLSDVTMALGDPLISTTLAHLPSAQLNLAAVGSAKSLAVFFESPIIMILHAANALAPSFNSRKSLWKFTLLAGGILTLMLGLISLPPIFAIIGDRLLGLPVEMLSTVGQVLLLMSGWAFAIAWRRYFQGLLIYHGQSQSIAKAGLMRLFTVSVILISGFSLKISGAILAGIALMGGVLIEAITVTIFAYYSGATLPPETSELTGKLPKNLIEIWQFYYPLANSMLVVWGGRALLISIIAKSNEPTIAIASWSAGWGLVLVIANSTRMVQQIVIKYRHQINDGELLKFAVTVGVFCSSMLLIMSSTPIGEQIIQSFIGGNINLANNIKPVLLICAIVPLLVAMQNATQGFLISSGKTGKVNLATWLGTFCLLLMSIIAIKIGINGAIAAAIAMITAIAVEIACLLWQKPTKLA